MKAFISLLNILATWHIFGLYREKYQTRLYLSRLLSIFVLTGFTHLSHEILLLLIPPLLKPPLFRICGNLFLANPRYCIRFVGKKSLTDGGGLGEILNGRNYTDLVSRPPEI